MTDISPQVIESEISKIIIKEDMAFMQDAQQQKKMQYSKNKNEITKAAGILSAQKDILYLCASNLQVYQKIKTILSAEDFSEPIYQKVYQKIEELYQKNGTIFPAELVNYFELPEEQKKVTEIFAVVLQYHSLKAMEKALTEEVRTVKRASLNQHLAQLPLQEQSEQTDEQIKKWVAEKRNVDNLYITIADG